jgi:arabinogalactan endo-1,4-beta-galactosidase
LAPCDFVLFPTETEAERTLPDTIEEIHAESQRVTEKDFQEAFQNGGDGGTGVYMWEGTTSRVRAADMPYGEFYYFYSISSE